MPRSYSLVLGFMLLVAVSGCPDKQSDQATPTKENAEPEERSLESRVVEAGCATCIFHMEGVEGCPLAVRIENKSYLVVGSDIDAHGDAHAANGMCKTARSARTRGRIEGDKFAATSLALRP